MSLASRGPGKIIFVDIGQLLKAENVMNIVFILFFVKVRWIVLQSHHNQSMFLKSTITYIYRYVHITYQHRLVKNVISSTRSLNKQKHPNSIKMVESIPLYKCAYLWFKSGRVNLFCTSPLYIHFLAIYEHLQV